MLVVKIAPERWREYRELRLEALRTDPEAFGSTYESGLQRTDEWWRSRLEIAQTDSNRTVLFAEENGRLVGTAGAYPQQEPGCVDVIGMYVTPAERGRGIARALLQAVVDEIKADHIRLCVNADLPPAVGLYKSFGFRTLAETVVTREDGSSYLQLYMELNPSAQE